MQPKLQIVTMAVAYSATLGFCFLLFPLFWRRAFLAGVHWDGSKALRLAGRLLPLGFALPRMLSGALEGQRPVTATQLVEQNGADDRDPHRHRELLD